MKPFSGKWIKKKSLKAPVVSSRPVLADLRSQVTIAPVTYKILYDELEVRSSKAPKNAAPTP